MKFLDTFLPLWIFLSMAFGLFLGINFPQILDFYALLEVSDVNLAIALGLIIMLYPPLAKADYTKIVAALENKKLLFISLVLNWFVGPVVMFLLALFAYFFLPNFGVAYLQGVILIGLARCIAMVLVWVEISFGDKNIALSLVAFNSLFQILFFSIYAYIFMVFLPQLLGIELYEYSVSMAMVAKNVAIYLGIPFVLGFLTRLVLVRIIGLESYNKVFIKRLSPLSLVALLYVIVVMFSYKGEKLIALPFDVLLVALPLIAYFVIMFFISFYVSKSFGYAKCCAVSFSACGNNFELSLAVAIASFGIHSGQAFASIVGVLVEVPVMIALASWLKAQQKVVSDRVLKHKGESMQNIEEFLKITGAINDESRIKILAFLLLHSQEEMLCVCDLQEFLEMNQPRLSRHLKILKDAGFLELQRKGVWAYYGIKKDLEGFHKDILENIKALELSLPHSCGLPMPQDCCNNQ